MRFLYDNNLISRTQLRFYLKNQNIKFGDFLVEKKVLNQASLRKILALKNNSDKRLDEFILEQSILSEEQLKELLIEYYTKRKGLFLADSANKNDLNLSLWVETLLADKPEKGRVLFS